MNELLSNEPWRTGLEIFVDLRDFICSSLQDGWMPQGGWESGSAETSAKTGEAERSGSINKHLADEDEGAEGVLWLLVWFYFSHEEKVGPWQKRL